MKNDQLVKRILGSDVRGVRLREKLRTGWMRGVKRALNGKRMTVEQGRMIVRHRSEWRAIVNP